MELQDSDVVSADEKSNGIATDGSFLFALQLTAVATIKASPYLPHRGETINRNRAETTKQQTLVLRRIIILYEFK